MSPRLRKHPFKSIWYKTHLPLLLLLVVALFSRNLLAQEAQAINKAAWPLAASAYSIQSLSAKEQLKFLNALDYKSLWVRLGAKGEIHRLYDYLKTPEIQNGDISISIVHFNPFVQSGYDEQKMAGIFSALKEHHLKLWLLVRGKASQKKQVIQYYDKAAKQAAQFGVEVVLYPHASQPIKNAEQALEVVNQLGHSNLKLSLLWCHEVKTNRYREIAKILKRVAPHLGTIAVSGADTRGVGLNNRWRYAIMPLSQGNISLAPLTEALKEMKYQGPIMLKTHGIKTPPNIHMSQSLAKWRHLLTPESN